MVEARRFGIDEKRAVKCHSDKKGTALNYKVVGRALSELRCCSAISDDWAEEIEEDFEKRSQVQARQPMLCSRFMHFFLMNPENR